MAAGLTLIDLRIFWTPFVNLPAGRTTHRLPRAQDYDIKHVDVAIKDTAPGKVTATVTFDNFGKQRTIVLELIAIKNDWRIYDITWPRDGKPETLRGLFRLTRQR